MCGYIAVLVVQDFVETFCQSVFSYGLFNEECGSLEYAASNGCTAPEQCLAKNVEGGGRVLI
jgi:hypothetical protein